MQLAPAGLRRSTVRVGVFVLAVVVAMSVAELTSERFNEFTRDHALLSTFLTEAILLVGVYLVIDEIIERREARRWSAVMSLGIRALSTRADGPAEIVRRTLDEWAQGNGPVDYPDLVSGHADELANWLRADDSRARSFDSGLRQSATRLEDAIIRWGPDADRGSRVPELINLLPDIVDSARTAADTIAPPVDRVDGAGRGWAESERQLFKDSLLEILEHADDFRRRVSPRAH